jgi:hypothetical protein
VCECVRGGKDADDTGVACTDGERECLCGMILKFIIVGRSG